MKTALKRLLWQVYPNYFMNRYFRNSGNPEIEVELVHFFVSKDSTAIDVGAHGAKYTSMLSIHARRVLALEPIPHLVRGLRSFSFPNVEILEAAASDSAGTVTLYIPRNNDTLATPLASLHRNTLRDGAEFEMLEVKTVRLDDLCKGPVDFIKIDVEGHEVSVLKGARRLLETYRPTILAEANTREDLARLATHAAEIGYRIAYIDHGRFHGPTTSFDGIPISGETGNRVCNFFLLPIDGTRDGCLKAARHHLEHSTPS